MSLVPNLALWRSSPAAHRGHADDEACSVPPGPGRRVHAVPDTTLGRL